MSKSNKKYGGVELQRDGEINKNHPEVFDTSEKADLFDGAEQKLSLSEATRYRYITLFVTALSLVATLLLGITCLILSVSDNSDAAFAFSLDCLLDFLTSMVVLWRYFGNVGSVYSYGRERLACILLGLLFVISSVCITVKATYDFMAGGRPERPVTLLHLFVISTTVCSVLAIVKLFLGYKLESRAVVTDGVNSLFGAIMGGAVLASIEVYKMKPNVWYLDSVVSMGLAVLCVLYGVWLLFDSIVLHRASGHS